MAHFGNRRPNQELEFEDDDDEEDEDSFGATDRIRRSYHLPVTHQHPQTGAAHSGSSSSSATLRNQQQQQQRQANGSRGTAPAPETIQVTLNEGYFAQERRLFVNTLANVRQKLNSLRLFNPAKNEDLRQRQDEWNEKEKYTLDSLNEFKGQLDERFQWNKPEDGREVWPSKLQYFLAITSYSIGLGNVIRFPILVQRNGGLAFIIPFVIMLLLEGIPLFYLELAIGQRTRKAAISCWHSVSPFAAGIGLASAAVSFLIGLYYNTMVAWTLIYSWQSLTNKFFQLAECPANGGGGGGSADQSTLGSHRDYAYNGGGGGEDYVNNTTKTTSPHLSPGEECQLAGPFEYHWYRDTLNVSGDVGDWSHFNWPVAICLSLAWLISYLCLVRGLSSSKRLVYVISIFPYVILVIFFFKSWSLPGMDHGLSYLFEPDWLKLVDPYVWLQAAAQVFFSLGLGFGGLIALSSYNSINNNCYRDAIKVSLINFLTSMLAGVVIFSILGFKAHLSHERCQMEREQQISFYLADYNLKVLDYGAVFHQVPLAVETLDQMRVKRQVDGVDSPDGPEMPEEIPTTMRPLKKATKSKDGAKRAKQKSKKTSTTTTTTTTVKPALDTDDTEEGATEAAIRTRITRKEKTKTTTPPPPSVVRKLNKVAQFVVEKNETLEAQQLDEALNEKSSESARSGKEPLATTPTTSNGQAEQAAAAAAASEDEFSAEDAIASINNLDRQLDLGSPSGSFDYGDSDTEFVLNASNLIGRSDLERIIAEMNGQLPLCSIRRELDESSQGAGLVFVVIAEAISEFDLVPSSLSASSWAILFFLMILALGLDSQFGNLEGLLSSLTDLNFFNLNPNNQLAGNQSHPLNGHNGGGGNGHLANGSMAPNDFGGLPDGAQQAIGPGERSIVAVRQWATAAICLLSLALSLVLFAHGAGTYLFAIFDEYAGNFSLILIALFELLTISHIYGLKRFCDDCELMTGQRPHLVVLLSWRYISPILLLIVVLTTIKQFTVELNYDVWSLAAAAAAAAGVATNETAATDELHVLSKSWPTWAVVFGAALIVCCVIWIPLIAVLRIMRVELIPEDQRRQWFPAEELKEFHQLQDQERRVTKLERVLFGFQDDD